MKINGVSITHENFGDDPPRLDELAAYVEYAKARKPNVSSIIVTLCDDGAVDLNYVAREQKFERIRRVTGYLVGTTDRWNDAKQAEERDRVKHEPKI